MGSKLLVGVFLLLNISMPIVFAQVEAQPCNSSACALPNCRCSSPTIPGGLNSSETPQLVFLTFDEAVNQANFDFYYEVLSNRKNPNKEPITATFYVTHDHTNYNMVHELYRRGHEIALHSISGNYSQEYWQSLDALGWRQELLDERQILQNFALIPPNAIQGARAPQLQIGGDPMYSVLSSGGIKYDCSRPTQDFRNTGLWPYTNDYKSTQDCQIKTCPQGRYPKFWTVPMVNWVATDTSGKQHSCSMADHCVIDGLLPQTANQTFDLIKANFDNHYLNHKSPFGIFIRHGWVNGTGNPGEGDASAIQKRREGYVRFLDYLGTLPDVFIVSVSRGIQWVQEPTSLANINSFAPFKVTELASRCETSFACKYNVPAPIAAERMFRSCRPCPPKYPWVGNPLGR